MTFSADNDPSKNELSFLKVPTSTPTQRKHNYLNGKSFTALYYLCALFVAACTSAFANNNNSSLHANAQKKATSHHAQQSINHKDANNWQSIAHFRAFTPPIFKEEKNFNFISQLVDDDDGNLWVSGNRDAVFRYDGFEFVRYTTNSVNTEGESQLMSFHIDEDGQFWLVNSEVHLYDKANDKFVSYLQTDGMFIRDLVDDGRGGLWLSGNGFGFFKFDKQTKTKATPYSIDQFENSPKHIQAMAINKQEQILWMVSPQGVFKFDIVAQQLQKISTPLDSGWPTYYQKDIALDIKRQYLWIATTDGLLRLNTNNNTSRVYTANPKNGGLPTNFANTTFLDSTGNLWVGLEKEGICVYRSQFDDFLCLPPSEAKEDALPVTTIEKIIEDRAGSLWIVTNNAGFARITPSLEKFSNVEARITSPNVDYFKKSFDGILLDNNDVWIATDGGGIQVFNYVTGEFSAIMHDPNDPNSLPSNSVITITKDSDGYIWAGMWGGGMTKIDPKTLTFTHFKHDVNNPNSLAGNHIFDIEFDDKGRAWISVWYKGMQMYDPAIDTFTPYIQQANGEQNITGTEIGHIYFDKNKIWTASGVGIETVDLSTGEIELSLELDQCYCNKILSISNNRMLIGATFGFYLYDLSTKEVRHYPLGIEDNKQAAYYFYEQNEAQVWIGTTGGVYVFNPQTDELVQYTKVDGLVGNSATMFGEIFSIAGELYFPSQDGVSIINPNDIPTFENNIPSIISSVAVTQIDQDRNISTQEISIPKDQNERVMLAHDSNSLDFSFTSINLVFPNKTRFKYRLQGQQDAFIESNVDKRVARYTNLQPGDYIFEVYAANHTGKWDQKGARFTFTVMQPWWTTWWARSIFIISLLTLIYLVFKWRLYVSTLRQKELSLLVKEKTRELTLQTEKVTKAGQALEQLNSELEERVDARTAELQVEVNERKVAEKKLFHLAFHDSLTGLPNREWLVKHLESLISKQRIFGLMFLDGDRFKMINDTHGHVVGDEILIASATRLTALLNDNMQAARLGGDEFTVVVEDATDLNSLIDLAQSIIATFDKPFELQGLTLHFNVSVGVVFCDNTYQAVTGALRDADIAMYQAKEAGKGVFKVFDHEMREKAQALSALEADLREAIKNESFHLAYQPIIDVASDSVNGFEALIRWHHPLRGNIPPDQFIPIAEETGLIVELGKWVLKEACYQLKQWQLFECLDNLSMSVNVSSNQLKGKDFINVLDNALTESGLNGKHLKLELTETSLIENTDILKSLLAQINERGVELAIDDFGTGYSSLSYLTQLPVQNIKIDRKFVDAIDSTPDGSICQDAVEIVRAAITLGQSVRMKVTAEGIETQTEMEVLKELGCDYAQGYLISKPLLADQVVAFLEPPLKIEKVPTENRALRKFREEQKTKSMRLNRRKPPEN